MIPFSTLLNELFQAVHKSNHYKDVKTYYFHNCIYSKLYKTPECENGEWIDTEWMFRNLDSDYKVILVGDAAMSPYELMARGGNNDWSMYNEEPGILWLQKFRQRYKKCIWLNPIKEAWWDRTYGSKTIQMIRQVFPMFELTLDGLDQGIQRLLVR